MDGTGDVMDLPNAVQDHAGGEDSHVDVGNNHGVLVALSFV